MKRVVATTTTAEAARALAPLTTSVSVGAGVAGGPRQTRDTLPAALHEHMSGPWTHDATLLLQAALHGSTTSAAALHRPKSEHCSGALHVLSALHRQPSRPTVQHF